MQEQQEGKKANKRRRSSQGTDATQNKRQKKPFNREEWEAQRNARQLQATASNLTGRNPVQVNQLFTTFYKVRVLSLWSLTRKDQKIVSEDEWETFVSYLDKELPTTFRVSTRSYFTHVLQEVQRTSWIIE